MGRGDGLVQQHRRVGGWREPVRRHGPGPGSGVAAQWQRHAVSRDVQVYDLALYLPRKAGSAEAALGMAGPKRLAFIALRDLPGTDLGLAFIKGLQANNSSDAVQRHAASSTRLIEIFSGKSKLSTGDSFAMDYLPGKGTQFFIQGEAQGAPVGDAEFFGMVLRIWLGPRPVDADLRDALLGIEARSAY
jgi:hypothetical protein